MSDRTVADSTSEEPEPAGGVATLVTSGVLVGCFAASVASVVYRSASAWHCVDAVVILLFLLGVQTVHSFRVRWRLLPPAHWTLALQVAITYLFLLAHQGVWSDAPGFLIGSILLILPGASAWYASVLVLLSGDYLEFCTGADLDDLPFSSLAVVLTGLTLYGLATLGRLLLELQGSRRELARQAVAKEQLRFARDVHDMFGYHLSAIALKGELALRLVPSAAIEAREELAEVLAMTRRALVDVRKVARGEGADLSLAAVMSTATPMLDAAGICSVVNIERGLLDSTLEKVLAAVLREGLSNMLRHSRATRCRISLTEEGGCVRLVLENDGSAAEAVAAPEGGGSGIPSMATRVGVLNGSLTWGPQDDGWYRLSALVPLPRRGANAVGVRDARVLRPR